MDKIKKKLWEVNIWQYLMYFIIYSFVGFVIETIFGVVTKGVLESRQSFLHGPFCAIYGVGACIMIFFLNRYKKSIYKLFIGGFLVGSVVEYLVSLFGEMMLDVKWWDYTNLPLNINGRICVCFSFFWGILAIYLIKRFNPRVDWLIDKIKGKIPNNLKKTVIMLLFLFMLAECIITGLAIKCFQVRKIKEYNLDIKKKVVADMAYDNIYSNKPLSDFIMTFWNDKKMIRTFPNLKIQDKEGKIIFFKDLVPDVTPYYVKIDTNFLNKNGK